MKHPLVCAALLLILASGANARDARPELLVRYCNAIMLQDAGYGNYTDYDPAQEINRQAPAGGRYLASLSFAQKRQQLGSLQRRLVVSDGASEGVAYVAAMAGIKPYANARRMLDFGFNSVEGRRNFVPHLAGSGEMAAGNLFNIYKRFPDSRIAMLLFVNIYDGAGSEVARSIRFRLLREEPRFTLALAMQTKRAFRVLTSDFERDGDEPQLRILRRLCHDRDPILRRGARQIRRSFHISRALYPPGRPFWLRPHSKKGAKN